MRQVREIEGADGGLHGMMPRWGWSPPQHSVRQAERTPCKAPLLHSAELRYQWARRGGSPQKSMRRGGSRCRRWCQALHCLARRSPGSCVPAAAQDYPTRTVKIIVPFGAGGPADIYARFVGQHLQESLKQSFVIENRPGAGAMIGTGEVAQVAARRLHAADDVEHAHHQRDAAPQQAVPADARLRAGGAGQLLRPHHGGAPLGAGQGPEGVHRAAEGQAGRPQLRLLRPRHALPHGGRAVQSHERHQYRARAASRQRRCAHRRDRRPRADDDRRHHDHGADRAGRPGAGARHDRGQALERAARRADHRRSRRARLRGHHLARHHGAGRHARSRSSTSSTPRSTRCSARPRPRRPGPSRAPSRSS